MIKIKSIAAIYEHGVIRPAKKLPLSERQRLQLQIELPKSIARATKAIIHIRPRAGKLIAESPQFSPLES